MPETTKSGRNTTIALVAVLAVVTIGLYAPVLGHGFIDLDDNLYVTDNTMVRQGWTWSGFVWAWSAVYAGYWIPLTWLSHITDCALFGLHPAGHHATNVLLHCVNTVFLFLLLRRMTGCVWRSAAVAALFGWHPLRVESVAWVTERKDVLSAFFFFATIWSYFRYQEEAKTGGPKTKLFYGLSLLLFACGLMSKPMLVTLPFVLLLLDYWPWARLDRHSWKRLTLEKWPFLALSAAVSVVTFLTQRSGGAVATNSSIQIRALNAVMSYGRYLGHTFWPARLAVLYPTTADVPVVVLGASVFVLAAVTLLALWQRQHRYLAAGWLWYLGMLVPVIQLVQSGPQSSADRFTYLPLIGIFIMLVWGTADLMSKCQLPASVPACITGACLLACIATTERQLAYWANTGTLFRRTLAVTEKNYLAWNCLGDYLEASGQKQEALPCFSNSLAVSTNNYLAWNNIGAYLLAERKYAAALQCFSNSAQDRPSPAMWRNAGLAQKALRHPALAAEFFNKALGLDPNYIAARMSLADLLSDAGRNAEAEREYRTVLKLEPGNEDAHCNLACVLAGTGRNAEAMAELQDALLLNPSDASAHCDVGNILTGEGKFDQAAEEYRTALRLKPESPEIHVNLGTVLAQLGRRQQAADEFKEALRLAPNYAQAREQLKALSQER